MTNRFFDALEGNKNDFVFVHKSIPVIFDGVYVDVSETLTNGIERYSSVRLTRRDARALAAKLIELTNDE